ncbi:MAG: cytochrome b/b6 domain-containing protein [Deltaproteobacteria bacterium]|nr:cytochrome b/b6 domain-containing protein [Candidatus Tharpella sp.]
MEKKNMVYLNTTPIRIWHWINALGIITLCLSGAQIRFPEYITLLGSYKSVILLHNTAGYVVTVSLFIWFIYYTFVTRTLAKLYVPTMDDLKNGVIKQVVYYFFNFFLGRGENPHHPTPDSKFNAMQKSAYLAVMVGLMPLVCVTGILLINVDPVRQYIVEMGGLKILVSLHFLVGSSLCAFLFTHMYLSTLGHSPMAHIVTMWTGWEEEVEGHGGSTDSH